MLVGIFNYFNLDLTLEKGRIHLFCLTYLHGFAQGLGLFLKGEILFAVMEL